MWSVPGTVRKTLRLIFRRTGRVALLAMVALVLAGCLGPKPVLRDYKVQAPPRGSDQPYKVEAVVANEGPGAGQVKVEVSLTNKRTGDIFAQEEKDVDLQKDQTVHVLISVSPPPSAQNIAPQDVDVKVEADYPVE